MRCVAVSATPMTRRDLIEPPSKRARAFSAAILDQAMQSLTSLGFSVAAAGILSVRDFGIFSLMFVSFTVAWGSWRALVIEPFMMTAASRLANETNGQIRSLAALQLRVLSLPALASLVASFFVGGLWQSCLLFLAIALPVTGVLDGVRAVNIATQAAIRSIRCGVTWIVAFGGLTMVVLLGDYGVGWLMVAYVIAAVAATLAGLSAVSVGPVNAVRWAQIRTQGRPLVVEFLLTAASVQLLVVFVGIVGGLEESAGFRGAMVIAGPITTLIGGSRLALLADASRYRTLHGDGLWAQYLIRSTLLFTIPATVFVAAIIVVATRWGDRILGDTWVVAEPALAPFLFGTIITIPHLVAAAILRARHMARVALRVRVLTLPLSLGPAVLGATIDGARGASIGFLVGVIAAGPVWGSRALEQVSGKRVYA